MKYSKLARLYEELESTESTLEKTSILAEFFQENGEQIEETILLVIGRPFPNWQEYQIGISGSMMVEIISMATGRTESEIEESWKNEGDLGDAAAEMVQKKTQQRLMSQELTVETVLERIRKVAEMSSPGLSESVNQDKKKKEIADLVSSAEPSEARYIVRTVLETLRMGVGEGIVRDALAEAFFDGEYTEEIQQAYDFTNDFTEVAEACKSGIEEIRKLEIEIFRPINSMLAKKVETIEEGFEEVGKPAAIDRKYDGVRAQIHVRGDEIKIFTRRLEDVTEQFPDAVEAVKDHLDADRCIIDTEIIGYNPDDGSTIPFQKLSKRVKRKYEIQKMAEEIPVEVRPFDLIYLKGSCLQQPYRERWKRLSDIVREEKRELRLTDHEETGDEEQVQQLQQESLATGHEGIMMKNLKAEYKPGNRVGYMVKLKPTMETLDLAITGGEWSEGRRTGWIGSLKLGCYDSQENEYQEIGKMATGLTDEQLEEITERLRPLITEEDGRDVKVKPEVVVEVEYEEIQESPSYGSGYALRFPRLKNFRDDKEEADSLEKVESLYSDQK